MLLTESDLEQILKENLDVKEIRVTDFKGGNHWDIEITAADFNGLNRVKREQLVQRILAPQLADESIHALKLKTKGTED